MIHPTAIISPQAQPGRAVSIGAYSVIGDDVVIHDEVKIAAHVVIVGPCEIGAGTQIFPFASLGQPPQDLKFSGERTRLVIGERNVIREYVTMNRGTAGGGGITRIGSDNLFMAQAHIAHDCQVGSHNIFANAATLAGHVEVGNYATVGAYSGIHQYCRAGDHAFIGGYSVVVKDALPFARSVGNHAKCYGVNSLGLRRRHLSNETIRHIQQAFHLLLTSKLNTTQALEKIRAEIIGIPEVDYLVQFIESSQRGVTK
jgi:UDP-N-acetylglucosamine acyltransferase